MAQTPSSPGKKSFHRHVERAIAHNETAAEDKRKSLHVHYKKLNGRTVKRKISPLKMNGHTIIAYDHKRKALRSFRMERVKHMEKAAVSSTLTGAVIGGLAGHAIAREPAAGALLGAGIGYLAGRKGKGKDDTPQDTESREKTAFLCGFEKRAFGWAGDIEGSGVGGTRHEMLRRGQINKKQHKHMGHVEHHMGRVKHHQERAEHHMRLLGDASAKNPAGDEKRAAFERGFKGASAFAHGAELAGLGILAAPAVQHLRGKEMSEGAKAKSEVAGLGVLAAPSAVAAAKGAWRAGKGLFHKG